QQQPPQPQHITPYPYHDLQQLYPQPAPLPYPTIPISRPNPPQQTSRSTQVDHLVSAIGGSQRAIYPIPTFAGQNRPISSTHSPQVIGYRGNVLYRESQCGGIPTRQPSQPTYPHIYYGDRYMRGQQMQIPYPGGIPGERHADESLGGSAQRGVAMPTTLMPAVPAALYHHDYDQPQNGHRMATSSNLHSHPIV
uniref:Uncharacterized protein n=1 Tax=Ciona savignyi TaxID=51511 RepID=H2Y6P2_CIOSA